MCQLLCVAYNYCYLKGVITAQRLAGLMFHTMLFSCAFLVFRTLAVTLVPTLVMGARDAPIRDRRGSRGRPIAV